VVKGNKLHLYLTSNPDIHTNLTGYSHLGNSDHCQNTLQHNFASNQNRPFFSKNVLHYSKADWDSLKTFLAAYNWYAGFPTDLFSFASVITNRIQLGVELLILSCCKPGSKHSPKWFNLKYPKAVKNKNDTIKEYKLHQTPKSKA